jgi:hypothetical protein
MTDSRTFPLSNDQFKGYAVGIKESDPSNPNDKGIIMVLYRIENDDSRVEIGASYWFKERLKGQIHLCTLFGGLIQDYESTDANLVELSAASRMLGRSAQVIDPDEEKS